MTGVLSLELGMGLVVEQIAGFRASALGDFSDILPWELTLRSTEIVGELLNRLPAGFTVRDRVAIHRSATIEEGAILNGPAIIGQECFVAVGAYVRGGCWLENNCVLGPGTELKSSFVFGGTKLAHFNFVGDSILGSEVNLEAGAIIANYRNECSGVTISFTHGGKRVDTGVEKFGALVGDRSKIGANAVVAPGAILPPATIVKRLSLVDQG